MMTNDDVRPAQPVHSPKVYSDRFSEARRTNVILVSKPDTGTEDFTFNRFIMLSFLSHCKFPTGKCFNFSFRCSSRDKMFAFPAV